MHDPRNPDAHRVVSTDSDHPSHQNLRKTLVLLKLESRDDGPIYFVITGLSSWPATLAEMRESDEYFYEEAQCATNFIPVEMVAVPGDADPHGLFDLVDVVWMTDEYDGSDEYLWAVFPQLNRPSTACGKNPID